MDWEEADDETTADDDLAQTENDKHFQRQAQPISFWQMIRRFFFQTPSEKRAEQQQRLSDLNLAIVNTPDVAANYMLRGEIYLEQGQYELARDDFLEAIQRAETQFESDSWGLAAQSVMDRARENLRQVMQYLE